MLCTKFGFFRGEAAAMIKATGSGSIRRRAEYIETIFTQGRATAAESIVRFVMGFFLARGKLLGGIYPFGTAFLASCTPNTQMLGAIAGVLLGSLTLGNMLTVTIYVSASFLAAGLLTTVERGRFANDPAIPPCAGFAAALMVAIIRVIIAGFSVDVLAAGITEMLLSAFCAYAFRKALAVRKRGAESVGSVSQAINLAVLASALLAAVVPVKVFGRVSIGRMIAIVCVQLAALAGGAGAGAVSGTIFGLVMDMSGGTLLMYGAACGLAGAMMGCLRQRGRMISVLGYCLADAAAVLWAAAEGAPDILFETFAAAVIVMLLPGEAVIKASEYMPVSPTEGGLLRSRLYMRDRVRLTQRAFEKLADSVGSMESRAVNDEDIAGIYERAALGVCRKCPGAKRCWQAGYGETIGYLNDATSAMLERGQLQAGDLPDGFTAQCCRTADYVGSVNAELKAWLCRKQYRARFNENLAAVCSRYRDVAEVFGTMASQLDADPIPAARLERRMRTYMRGEHLAVSAVVYRDGRGRLHTELAGSGLNTLRRDPKWLDKLSAVLETKLRTAPDSEDGRVVLLEAEELTASVGTASAKRRGHGVSGDGSRAFTTDDGKLCVILSDGMGTGREAGKMSADSCEALENFMRAGVSAGNAVGLLESLMMMENQDDIVSATVDMLVLDLLSGDAQLFKCGSAPTYVRRRGEVKCIRAGGFAPGLSPMGRDSAELTDMHFEAGDLAVIISDGVLAGESDDWLRAVLEESTDGPRELARKIAETSAARYGASDDITVLTVLIGPGGGHNAEE